MKHEIYTNDATAHISKFYSAFLELCGIKGKTPSAVAKESGISSGAPTAWKNGSVPKPAQREKLCAYFEVSEDTLLGYAQKEKPAPVSESGLEPERIQLIREIEAMDIERVKAFLITIGKGGSK